MSDVLDRIRRELQERLDSTRAAAQEHERVRAALDALEQAARPFERATRRAAGEAGRQGRRLAARARPAGTPDPPAATGSAAAAGASPRAAGSRQPRASRSRTSSGGPSAKASAASSAEAPAGASARPTRRRAGAKSGRTRAPRGANREAVLAVVRDRPGVTSRELAVASGVSGGTLYALLRRLSGSGELDKRELPGGQTGYALRAQTPAPTSAANADGQTRAADATASGPSAGRPTASDAGADMGQAS